MSFILASGVIKYKYLIRETACAQKKRAAVCPFLQIRKENKLWKSNAYATVLLRSTAA